MLPDNRIRELDAVNPFTESQLQPASYDVQLDDEFIMDGEKWPRTLLGLALRPGECVLGVTKETITCPDDIAIRVEGKSSIGRKFILVHVTAGFVDPGFRGKVTLEIVNLSSKHFVLLPGMLIAQLSFIQLAGVPDRVYSGRYQDASGVEASKL